MWQGIAFCVRLLLCRCFSCVSFWKYNYVVRFCWFSCCSIFWCVFMRHIMEWKSTTVTSYHIIIFILVRQKKTEKKKLVSIKRRYENRYTFLLREGQWCIIIAFVFLINFMFSIKPMNIITMWGVSVYHLMPVLYNFI